MRPPRPCRTSTQDHDSAIVRKANQGVKSPPTAPAWLRTKYSESDVMPGATKLAAACRPAASARCAHSSFCCAHRSQSTPRSWTKRRVVVLPCHRKLPCVPSRASQNMRTEASGSSADASERTRRGRRGVASSCATGLRRILAIGDVMLGGSSRPARLRAPDGNTPCPGKPCA